jgi:hypothetical protein
MPGLLSRLWPDRLRGPLRPRILVGGMPKSGTTAIAMLLGAAAELDVVSDPFNQLDEAGIDFRDRLYGGDLTLERLVARHRARFRGGLVKDPNFAFFLPELLRMFPDSDLVFTVRDPRDNIRSILDRLDLPGDPTRAPGDLGGLTETWRRVIEGRTPRLAGADYIERLTRRWTVTAAAYLDHRDAVHLVRYEDFRAAKEEVIRETLLGMGLSPSAGIGHLVDRQFQPRGQRNVDWEEFFGADALRAIEEECGPTMEQLGYARERT